MANLVYKICTRAEWDRAVADGCFEGSAADLADGFIHFSTAGQAPGTAERHFAGQQDLVLVRIDIRRLPREALKWEPSRGGALFPHLHAPLPADAALRVDPLPWQDGRHRFPEDMPDD